MPSSCLLAVGVSADGTRFEVHVGDDRRLRLYTGQEGARLTPITALCLIEVLRDLVLRDGEAWHRLQLRSIFREALPEL